MTLQNAQLQLDDAQDLAPDIVTKAAYKIADRLGAGFQVTRKDINAIFEKLTGSSDAEDGWSVKITGCAIELGELIHLREHSCISLNSDFAEAERCFGALEQALPPQHNRHDDQIALQQFSTPARLAWAMAFAAGIKADDIVLEPSAGTGVLAIWPHLASATLILNEIDDLRRACLSELFPDAALSSHDGELIDELLPPRHNPNLVLMNPPFAQSAERGKDGRAALRHLRSAWRRLATGGRLIAIMPEGFDAAKFAKNNASSCALRLDARILRSFARRGTGITVRMVAFDKIAAEQCADPIEIADFKRLCDACCALPDRAASQSAVLTSRPKAKPIALVLNNRLQRPVAPTSKPFSGTRISEKLVFEVLEDAAPTPEQKGIYLAYRPSRIVIDNAPVHPTPLVESVAMGSVAAPVPEYQPVVPAGWREKELLSDAQCETLIYAVNAFARDLPGTYKPINNGSGLEPSEEGFRYRTGFFLGDGTGAGKGREIASVIMDRWLQGHCRHIWITKNEALLEDARRDWSALGGLPLDIQSLSNWKLGSPVSMFDGILFVTYPTLRSGRMDTTRLAQILEWAGEEYDGVLAFDEAHAMANALGGTGSRGKIKGSEQGMAGLRLQNLLPRARILYASATGASDIANLGYAARLGLWGPETAFPNYDKFLSDIRAGGISAMELVARDLKSQGLYLARALSFAGVEYEILEHALSADQISIYDEYAAAWAIIHKNLEAALEATRIVDEDSGDTLNRNAKAAALSIFEGTKQRFFAQLLLSMKLPSLLPAIELALEDGHSAVVQLVSTAEAMLNRRLADLSVEEREQLDIELSPREYVIDYLSKSFPVRLMQVFRDDDGNLRSEPMSTSDGHPVLCPRAVQARDAMIEKLCALPPIWAALDAVIERFGTDHVAEVTGRTRRLVNGSDGRQRLERRTARSNLIEAQSFMDGEKRVLVFSDAGGTGRSYHADLDAQNQQRRVHFLLEPGWRADNAIQGLGRTNRTNQASAPLFRPVTTDVKGERRFISTIARRLDSLGALTRGQRQTGGQNLFDPADNLESEYARDALTSWFHLLYEGKLDAVSLDKFQNVTGLKLETPDGDLAEKLPTIQRWLNRILALPIALQNAIIDEYLALIEARVEAAREAGTLDLGVETIAVDEFKIISDRLLRTDSISGATTHLVTLETRRPLKPLRFKRLCKLHDCSSPNIHLLCNARSGGVALSVPTRRMITDEGETIERRRLIRPLKSVNWTLEALSESLWEQTDFKSFRKCWLEEEEKAASEIARERVHLATGLLLPVWNKIPGEIVRVTRIAASDGRSIIGREISELDMPDLARAFGLDLDQTVDPSRIAKMVMQSGKALALQSHDDLMAKRSLVNGSQRLELTGFSAERLDWYKSKGCFTEIIRYRTRLFVPVNEAAQILEKLGA
jgi:predicted RNA methylase